MDIIYLGIAAAFCVMTWTLLKLCERLAERKEGER
jgi:hypothetical protein